MTPMEEFKAERQRQIDEEGWTPTHDDAHDSGEMLRAAVIYLWHGTDREAPVMDDGRPQGWPWHVDWWKPKDRRRNLIRAGALCLAEKERCERGGYYTGPAKHKLQIAARELAALDAA